MSMSTMTTDGELMVPNGWTGKIDSSMSTESKRPLENRIITNALQKIDRDIEQLFQLRASLTGYGFSKICPTEITTVTEDEGLVLGAKEKNPALEGTMANETEKLKAKKINLNILSEYGVIYQLQSSYMNQGVVHFNFGIEVKKEIPPYTYFASADSAEGGSTPLILTEIHQRGVSYAAFFNSGSRTITSMAGNIPAGHYFVKS